MFLAGYQMKAASLSALTLCALLLSGTFLNAETLNIAVEDEAGPWSFKDGSGYANDVVKAAFQAVGMDVSFTVMPYELCKEKALSGEVCACFSMSWLEEFEGKIQFSKMPLFACKSGYFSNVKKPLKASTQSQLSRGSVVGVVKGYEYPPAVYQLVKDGVIRLDESPSEILNLQRLAAGKVDAAIVNYNDIKSYRGMEAIAGVKGQVKRAFDCGILNSHIGFSLKHPQGAMAAKKFDEGYGLLASDRRLRELQKKWAKAAFEKRP
jgi:ABC-type amino acid transport substrate-binding protein